MPRGIVNGDDDLWLGMSRIGLRDSLEVGGKGRLQALRFAPARLGLAVRRLLQKTGAQLSADHVERGETIHLAL